MPNITSNNFGVARMVYDGAGNIVGIKGPSGEIFDPSPKLYDWANIPDPSTVPAFTEIRVNPDSMLSGQYRRDIPIRFVSNEDQTLWKPDGEQVLYSGLGSAAAPILTGSISNNVELTLIANASDVPTLPAGLMYPGMRIKIRTLITRVTGSATALQTFHRINTVNNLSGDIISNHSSAATAGSPAYVESELRVHTLGDRGSTGGTAKAVVNRDAVTALPTVAIGVDINTGFSTTQLVYISLSYKNSSATDTHNFIWFDVRIAP